jgi:hypothetical protein
MSGKPPSAVEILGHDRDDAPRAAHRPDRIDAGSRTRLPKGSKGSA